MKTAYRELAIVAGTWALFAVWVLAVAALAAYGRPAGEPLLWGFPAWVVWGIVLPWLAADVVTVVFALRMTRDREGDR